MTDIIQNSVKRIQFIDLAKGVCILLVVISHCGVDVHVPFLQALRMPLYFILSGLFFKDYGSFLNFLVKKTNKILIPFIFFYLTAYLIFYTFEFLSPGLIKSSANGVLDIFTQRQYFNGPIWFLLSLFWSNIIFCIISLNIKNEYIRASAVIAIGLIGIILGENNVFLPCMIDTSLTSLPFFYTGYILRKLPILYPNKFDKYNLIISIVFFAAAYVLSIFFDNPHISFQTNTIWSNPIIIYVTSLCSVLGILFICKTINHVPGIVYLGRYSIIILCLHHLIYRPITLLINKVHLGNMTNWIVFIITILICWALIPICIKYIPYFTAQKDLIKLKEN